MENLLEETINSAKQTSRIIVESGQEHQFIILLLTPSGVISTAPVVFDKNAYKSSFTQILMATNAYAYVMINEAWGTRLDKDSPLLADLLSGRKKVSDLPPDDKEEKLFVIAAENGKSYRSWSAKISYDRDNSRHLGTWEEMPSEAKATGRMVVKEW